MAGFGISATEPRSYFSLLFGIDIITSAAGSCEHSKEPLNSIGSREFLDQLSDCQLLKKDCFMELVK
jgi:hypothetical protein